MRTFQQTLARDLVLSNGRLVLIDSVKAVATKLRNRLLLFSGEWFLDTRLGVPWFVFFEKNPDLDSLRRLVLSVITETSELITEVPQLDLDLDRATRTLRITFQVVCDGSLIEGDTAGEFFVDGAPVYVDPVPVLTSVTSVSQVGGTVTATGSAFLPGAVLWTDGVARATTYVNATTLTAVVPAHAVGSVNAYVVQSSGTSNTVSFAYTSSAVDPATFLPSGYWEQRGAGDVNDYSQTDTDGAGPDVAGRWEDRSGNSRHWGQNTGGAGTLPSTGTAIDGSSPIVFDAPAGKSLLQTATLGDFGTASEFVASLLVKLPAGLLPAWNVNAFANSTLVTDSSGWFSIMCGSEGGVNYIGVAGYDTAWRYARAPITTGVYQQVNVCHLGGQLMVEVNAPPAIDAGAGIRKSVACGNIGQVVHALVSRNAGVGAALSYDALSFFFRQTLADARFADLRAWWRTRYASLTGEIPG